MEHYYEKIVVTKGICEVFRYQRLNVNGGGERKGEGEYADENYKQSQRRRRNNIRQLICTNFDAKSKFITLTFKDDIGIDIRDVQACNGYFKKFVLRLKRRYPGLRYVAVIEFQDKNGRGAVHYHMISNIPYVKKDELSKIWGAGFVKINSIDKVDNVGAYVIKYMTTDMDDKRLAGQNAYLHSKGLEKPVELVTWRKETAETWQEVHNALENEKPSYEATYESEVAGRCEYRQYNFNRKTSIKQTD